MKAYNLETAERHRSEITELYLHHCGLEQVPALVFGCPQLRVLEISANPLRELPEDLADMGNLETLVLRGNGLRVLPASLSRLTRLRRLDLSENPVGEFPGFVFSLKNLTALHASRMGLESLPPDIGSLSELQTLDLSGNRLRRLPPAIGRLPGLQHLDLQGNLLRSLPAALKALTLLERINLSNNRLRALPAECLQSWGQLRQLLLAHNALTELPGTLHHCRLLRRLDLSHNKLGTLPEETGNLNWLLSMDLSHNRLIRLPESIVLLGRLEHLDLGRNQLQALAPLPASLKTLDLSHNHFEQLPPRITGLSGLQMFSVAYNRLRSLPDTLCQLKGLRELYIQGNEAEISLETALCFDELERLRGSVAGLENLEQLKRFRRACRQDQTPAGLRPLLFRVYCGDPEPLRSLSLPQLFRALHFGIREVAIAVRTHLTTLRGRPVAEVPLAPGAGIALLGKAPFDRRQLAKQLAAAGLQLCPVIDTRTTHIVIDLQPHDYQQALDERFVFLSPRQLNEFLNRREAGNLAPAPGEAGMQRLRQLLLHPAAHNVQLAVQLLQGRGVPPALLTELFVAWKRATRGPLRESLRALLESNLPEEDRRILSYRYSLKKTGKPEEWEKNIRKYTEGTVLDEDRLRSLL